MIHVAKRHLLLIAKGFCMGAADIVPGVSGGTMAFILGIYEELIEAISLFGQKVFWTDIFHGKVHHAFTLPKWGFLCSVGGGIALAILTLAAPLEYLLAKNPVAVWSFFFGLVLASVFVVAARIRRWSVVLFIAVLIGTVLAYLLVGLVPVETPSSPWFLFVCGAVAICAMILPGISGAFLLVLLGKYAFILSAVNNRDVAPLAYVGAGAGIGIVAFSQVLRWLFHTHHDSTVAVLMGLMIGSLRKIWPWKIGDVNMLPALDMHTLSILGVMVAGAVLVALIELLAARMQP